MQMHANIWGHVALETPSTVAMQVAEEASEMEMFRCRYRKMKTPAKVICVNLPATETVIFNPNTLRDIAALFEVAGEKASA